MSFIPSGGISDCTRCFLHETACTVGIASVGNGNVLVVGQSPTPQDDLEGVAYFDKEGGLLRSLLADAGFNQGDYTLSNAVRCVVHGGNPPIGESIDACRYHLVREIQSLRPVRIVALGDVALRSLTKRKGLAELRGTAVPLHRDFGYECEVYPTYSPRYVVGRPQSRAVVVADLRRVRDSTKEPDAIEWRIWDGGPLRGDVIAFDIETDYDYATKTGGEQVTQLAVSSTSMGTVVSRDLGLAEALCDAADAGATICGHNSWEFDVPRLRKVTGRPLPWGEDTLYLAYLDDETQPRGLEPLAVKYCGARGWKDTKDAEQGTAEFFAYNARDAFWTLRLRDALQSLLGRRSRLASEVILPARRALCAASNRGIWIAKAPLRTAGLAKRSELAVHEDTLRQRYQIRNPRSAQELARALIEQGHTLGTTESGQPCTDADTLSKLDQTPVVLDIKAFRKAQKVVSSTIAPYEKIAAAGGRVHPEYSLLKVTGRTSAKNRNVQQLDRELKKIFGAPPGREFTQCDYASVEFRVAGFVAQEQTIIANYKTDPFWDPHRWLAERFYRVPLGDVTIEQRQVTKSANFGLLFMATWQTLQDYARRVGGVILSDQEAKNLREFWHDTFPAFRKMYAATARELRQTGYAESLTGRRRHFGLPGDMRGPAMSQYLREGVNFKVQGLAADIAQLALRKCFDFGLPVNGFFHDAISFEFNEGETAKYQDQIDYCMIQYPQEALKKYFDIDFDVPLIIETQITPGEVQVAV